MRRRIHLGARESRKACRHCRATPQLQLIIDHMGVSLSDEATRDGCTGWSAETTPIVLEDTLETGEQHLDLLA
jgi:hypothetical protein